MNALHLFPPSSSQEGICSNRTYLIITKLAQKMKSRWNIASLYKRLGWMTCPEWEVSHSLCRFCSLVFYPFIQLLTTLFIPGKTASLGEMIQHLAPLGVSVPGGFGVSSSAYDAVLDRFELRERLDMLLKDIDVNDLENLAGKCDT